MTNGLLQSHETVVQPPAAGAAPSPLVIWSYIIKNEQRENAPSRGRGGESWIVPCAQILAKPYDGRHGNRSPKFGGWTGATLHTIFSEEVSIASRSMNENISISSKQLPVLPYALAEALDDSDARVERSDSLLQSQHLAGRHRLGHALSGCRLQVRGRPAI